MKKKYLCKGISILLLAQLAVGMAGAAAMPALAAQTTSTSSAADADQTARRGWTESGSCLYYYNSAGKKLTGLQKIGSNLYYFDAKGVQRTGWQKIGGSYYYFRIANGKSGKMLSGKKVNGITLQANGKAKVTAENQKKLTVLRKANQIVESRTKPTQSKPEKLRRMYDYCLKELRYLGSPTFQNSKQWEVEYANAMFQRKQGACYAYGAAFAFLANAVGYGKCYAISSGGHGWAEVNGKVYDPDWELVDSKHSYFGVDYSLSGVDGRPGYRNARVYVKQI